jgi:hypothetical protein
VGSQGDAGSVTVASQGRLTLLRGGEISSSTFAQGQAGSVTVSAGGALIIDGQGNPLLTGIFSSADRGSQGGGGSVRVAARGDLDILGGGSISSNTFGSGDAGRVDVEAGGALTVDGRGSGGLTGIASEAVAGSQGDAGSVRVESKGRLAVLDGGLISSSTLAAGNAGSVTVKAGQGLLIDTRGNKSITGIVSNAVQPDSQGEAGSVRVAARGGLRALNGGIISSDSFSQGRAGSVTVAADRIALVRHGTISAQAEEGSSGRTGDVAVRATESLLLRNLGEITVANESKAAGPVREVGDIRISAPVIELSGGSQITTASSGGIDAGNIGIDFGRALVLADRSFIHTTARTGNGGAIAVRGGGPLILGDSDIQTTVTGPGGNGGAIEVQTAGTLFLLTGLVQANAVSGNGGQVSLNVGTLIPSGNTLNGIEFGTADPFAARLAPDAWQPYRFGDNVIQAVSLSGVGGTISLAAPQLNLNGALANLGEPGFDEPLLNPDYCALGGGSSLTVHGQGALPRRSRDLLLY